MICMVAPQEVNLAAAVASVISELESALMKEEQRITRTFSMASV